MSTCKKCTKVIIVKIYGGLAGQMMQYAFACFLEKKRNEEVKIDISFFGGQSYNQSFRKFELLNWNTKFSLANEADYQTIFSDVKFSDKLRFKLLKQEVRNNAYFYEKKSFSYDTDVLDHKFRIFDGYWVNNQYIKAVENRLSKEFTPRYPVSEKNRELILRMENTNSVSIHFRRGDYVGSVHDVLKNDYYAESIEHIKKYVVDPCFYIFSDDIEYVKTHYDLPNAVYIDHNKGEESYWDIFLMSNCKHNVIANSGFSFWGAWLNKHTDARVIAPSSWMQTENKIEQNLLLPNWHII
jgi:hypothetical protein